MCLCFLSIDKIIILCYNVIQEEVLTMNVSVRLNDEDTKLIKAYADMYGITVSELIRKSVLERIEDEFDLKLYNEAIEEYKKNPVSYSLDEVEKELGL